MTLDPAWIALIGTICGGVGLKLVEHYLGRNKVKTDDATQIRDELRQEIATLRSEVEKTEQERDNYRNQYYESMDKIMAQRADFEEQIRKLKEAHAQELEILRNEAFQNVQRQNLTGEKSQPTPLLDNTEPLEPK